MRIFINNLPAVLKEKTSFEYISENRLFSGSDGYSLTITFPLRGCPQNLAIFGHINRADVAAKELLFDCEIRTINFSLTGSITITEINDAEVKTQFLEGRAEHNFNPALDKLYINELDLGKMHLDLYREEDLYSRPWNAWTPEDELGYIPFEAVALPWVNDASGNIQNDAYYSNNESGYENVGWHWTWATQDTGWSWQPYLLHITKKICEAMGYTYDFTQWETNSAYRYLLICNTLPAAWDMPEYARALPHWTVKEYFEKLELFMRAEFTFDHRHKTVTFATLTTALSEIEPVHLTDIVDEHSKQIQSEDTASKYLANRNLVYKESDHTMWKFYSCDWLIRQWRHRSTYHTVRQMVDTLKKYATWDGAKSESVNALHYAEDVDMYFALNPVLRSKNDADQWQYHCVLQPINALGGSNPNSDEEVETEELEFVPVRLDWTYWAKGKCMFLEFNGYDEQTTEDGTDDPDHFKKTTPIYAIEAGEDTGKPEYYDRIYIGWWDGNMYVNEKKLPHPHTDNIAFEDDWSGYRNLQFSLRLTEENAVMKTSAPNVDPRRKVTFKFLSSTIPNVRAVYYIRGKRYICEKLTATFTERGMSQLIKGVFYPVAE